MGVVVNNFLLPANPNSIVSEKKLKKAVSKVSKIIAEYCFQQTMLKQAQIEQYETYYYDFQSSRDFELLNIWDVKLYEENYYKVIHLNIPKEKIKLSLTNEQAKSYLETRNPCIKYPTLKLIKLCFSIDYYDKITFIGDRENFFYIDWDTDTWTLTDHEDELKHIKCGVCDMIFGLEFIEYLKQVMSYQNQVNKDEIKNLNDFICPSCNIIHKINDLVGKTIFGRFRIRIEQGTPDYPNYSFLYELIEKEIGCELVFNKYMYL